MLRYHETVTHYISYRWQYLPMLSPQQQQCGKTNFLEKVRGREGLDVIKCISSSLYVLSCRGTVGGLSNGIV